MAAASRTIAAQIGASRGSRPLGISRSVHPRLTTCSSQRVVGGVDEAVGEHEAEVGTRDLYQPATPHARQRRPEKQRRYREQDAVEPVMVTEVHGGMGYRVGAVDAKLAGEEDPDADVGADLRGDPGDREREEHERRP
jgi:hypothetical protein